MITAPTPTRTLFVLVAGLVLSRPLEAQPDARADREADSETAGGRIEFLALGASFLAVAVSVFTLNVQRRLEHETSSQTLIHDQYELCRVLDVLRVEHPEVSHLLALPARSGPRPWENYHLFKDHVRKLFPREEGAKFSTGLAARLYLQEHATALHVCDIYEQTLYQRDLAKGAGDKKRFEVLDMLAIYYETRMLRNPRLRYHWDHGASDMMEESTRQRYDRTVRQAFPDDYVDPFSPLEDDPASPTV